MPGRTGGVGALRGDHGVTLALQDHPPAITGYRGYFGYELCHPLPVVNGRTVGSEYADKNARLACEYMRGVITEAKKQRAAA